jgi:hypothetical protein
MHAALPSARAAHDRLYDIRLAHLHLPVDDARAQVELSRRIGWINFLDLNRPEAIFYSLRLSIPEERMVAHQLCKLAVRLTHERTCLSNLMFDNRSFYIKVGKSVRACSLPPPPAVCHALPASGCVGCG